MIRYDLLLFVALLTFVATSLLWLMVHKRAQRRWATDQALAEGDAGLRAEAMRYCQPCKRRLKKLKGES
jgi:hypothetical protein